MYHPHTKVFVENFLGNLRPQRPQRPQTALPLGDFLWTLFFRSSTISTGRPQKLGKRIIFVNTLNLQKSFAGVGMYAYSILYTKSPPR